MNRPEDQERKLAILRSRLNDYLGRGYGDDDPNVAYIRDEIAKVESVLRSDSTPRIAGQPVGKPTE